MAPSGFRPKALAFLQFTRKVGSVLDEGVGLPAAGKLELGLARTLVALASAAFFLVALWEIGAPFGAGHFAASTAVALGGENMLRFHTLLPVIDQPISTPTVADCYCHHPFGIFWTSALFVGVFGHQDFVCRLPPLLLSGLTPPLLYALGRALWSPLAGATAAVAFVLTPIALAYANFNALEVPVIFATVLASVGYVRLRQSGQRRFMVVTLSALVFGVNSDWPAYVFAFGLLLISFVDAFVLGRRLEAREFQRRADLFAFGVVLVGGVALAYFLALLTMGRLDELIQQGRARAAGADRTLSEVLAARRYWILLMFTPLAITVGKLAAPVLMARVLVKRTPLELLPLLLLAMATFQYLVFSEGADVHVFWPHYFAPYFALALAGLGQSLREVVSYVGKRAAAGRPELVARLALGAAALGLLVPLLMARDAFATLRYARKTGGRFNEKGRFIQPDKDKVAALAFLSEKFAPNAVVGLDANMRRSLWVPWVLQRPTKVGGASTFDRTERYYIIDARLASDRMLRETAAEHQVTVIGPFWAFDLKSKDTRADAFSVERREPSFLERFFVSSTHALRDVTADAYWTWEIRDHLMKLPNPEPSAPPQGREQLRIAHNMAVRRFDSSTAARLRAQLLSELDRKSETLYEDDTQLLGIRYEAGASDVLSVYFESTGAADQRFVIRSRVEAPMAWSLVPADTLEWEVGLATTLPRAVWKRGYLYSSVTELLRRPGRERFVGSWLNTGPELPLKTKAGGRDVTLLVLP